MLTAKTKAEKKQEIRVHVRWMLKRDTLKILSIERASFDFPWSEEDFAESLNHDNCLGMVAEHKDQVVGFMVYEMDRDNIHLMNLAVHPDWRRYRIGSRMIETLLDLEILKQYFRRCELLNFFPHLSRIILEVRERNVVAQLFFKKIRENGFKAVNILRGYYADTAEDAYVMQYRYPKKRATAPLQETISQLC